MTKRQARKAAYRLILKESKSHQAAFDELSGDKGLGNDDLAEEISKIPSERKRKSFAPLVYLYIGLLLLIIALRSLSIYVLATSDTFNAALILMAVILVVAFPIYGIYGALTARNESYKTIAIIMGLSIFRSFRQSPDEFSTEFFLVLIPFVALIGLGLFIPYKLKTPYTISVVKEQDGVQLKSKKKYTFEASRLADEDLLDSELTESIEL
jgi:hypothetical protein